MHYAPYALLQGPQFRLFLSKFRHIFFFSILAKANLRKKKITPIVGPWVSKDAKDVLTIGGHLKRTFLPKKNEYRFFLSVLIAVIFQFFFTKKFTKNSVSLGDQKRKKTQNFGVLTLQKHPKRTFVYKNTHISHFLSNSFHQYKAIFDQTKKFLLLKNGRGRHPKS